jgi:hypothetical protein
MSETVKHPGTRINMDGKDWTVPALSVRAFRENIQTLMAATVTDPSNVGADAVGKQIDDALPVLYLAFKRNYPDVTEEQFVDMLDLNSYSQVMAAVMGQSGVTTAKPGE